MVCVACGLSDCKCCICDENYGIDCPAHPVTSCATCGLDLLPNALSSGAQNWCSCFTSDSFTNSGPNQSISNGNATNTSSNGNFQDCELPLETVSLDSSHPNIEFGSTHAQSPDTETSESSMSDTSDCLTTGNDQDEQIDYLPITCSEENELVTEETVLDVEEKLPLNPSHAQSLGTETSESSVSDISGSLITVKNLTEQMDYLVIPTEETGLVVKETIELVAEEIPLNQSHTLSHTETSKSSMSDTSDCLTTGNDQDEQIDYLPIICSKENELVTEETVLVVEENLPLNPSHAQSLDTETSESSKSDISGSLATVKNLTEQMDYLEVIPTEETELVAEETPINPSHVQSHTETSESSMLDISGCLTKGNNRTGQMGNFPTYKPSEETGLNAEETELLNSFNILNDEQISYNPVNSADRVKDYIRILAQNILKDTSSSRSETNNAEKNTLITQASNSSSGIGITGSPQVPFHGVVAVTPNLSTPQFSSSSHASTTNQPFMCVPTVSVRQKTVSSGPSDKLPFYTDSATRRLQGHFSESVQIKSPTKSAFSKGSKNKLSIPITPASKYAMSKGVFPRESGTIIRPVGRTLDWLNKMTSAPGDTNSPEDDCALSPSSSPPPVELVKDSIELQNETKSDTNATEPQSAVVASDESSSTFACSETTAHQGLTCAEDTSPADSENKVVEQTKVSEESLDSCVGVISNLSTSLRKELNNEETELKEQIQDSSKNSED